MSEQRRQWGINRLISIDTIVAFASLLGMILWVWYSGQKQNDYNSNEIVHLKETDQRHESEIILFKADIKESLKSINEKLDRMEQRRK